MSAAPPSRPPLVLLSPLPPQRNGLADYIAEYLPLLARDHALCLVVEAGLAETVRGQPGLPPDTEVIDEPTLLARLPLPADARVLYNLGNNGDCVWLLDLLHRLPGAVIVHDISLLHLHQLSAQRHRVPALMGAWLADDGHPVPHDFLGRDGQLLRSPGLLFQECLMLRRIAASARGLMVHSAYAERRLRGAIGDLPLGPQRPLLRLPHYVLPPRPPQPTELLQRLGIADDELLVLVPGFLSGNKMLYEALAAHHAASARLPSQRLRLVFAGEERPSEYDLSRRIQALWPQGDGPLVTGYLAADELDALLDRADVSLLLRQPTYGESSGLLPRAAMGGGEVFTVDSGAYPEFRAAGVHHLSVGAGTVQALCDGLLALAARRPGPAERRQRREAALQAAAALAPASLYPALRDWLARCGGTA